MRARGSVNQVTDATTPNSPIDRISEQFLEDFVELSPTEATYMGIQGHDHRLPDLSPAGYQALIDLNRRTIAEANAVQPGTAREEVAKDALLERLGLELETYEAGVPQYQLSAVASVPQFPRSGRCST